MGQFLFGVLAHAAIAPICLVSTSFPGWMYSGANNGETLPTSIQYGLEFTMFREPLMLPGLVTFTLIEVLFARTLYRVVYQDAARDGELMTNWARCWLWALVATFVFSPLGIVSFLQSASGLWPLVVGAMVLVGPTVLARKRRRSPGWQPRCPECRQVLRRLARPVCNECGEHVAIGPGAWRRSAVFRLAWDRRLNGGWVFAYVRTLLALVLTPWRAGDRVAADDRWGRAWTWLLVNWGLVFSAVVSAGAIHRAIVYMFSPPVPPDPLDVPIPELAAEEHRSFGLLRFNAIASNVLMVVATVGGVALAAALVWADPRLDRRTRRLAWKWTLYSAGLVPWFGVLAILATATATRGAGPWFLSGWRPFWVPVLLLPFVVAWSAGLRSLLARQARLRDDWLVRVGVYAGIWWATVLFVAPPGVWWCLIT